MLTEFQQAIRDYENSPVWAARAFAFKQSHGYWCDACKGAGKVDAHHRDYGDQDTQFRGIEPDAWLRALCRPCHNLVHSLTRNHGGPFNLRDATDYVIRTKGARQPLAAGTRDKSMGWADAAWAWIAILWWLALIVGAVAWLQTDPAVWAYGPAMAFGGIGAIIGVTLARRALR